MEMTEINTESVVDGNKILMLFDGYKIEVRNVNGKKIESKEQREYEFYVKYIDEYFSREVRAEDIGFDIVYHKSWNALQQIIDKIKSLKYIVVINQSSTVNSCSIHAGEGDRYIVRKSDVAPAIDVVWSALVEFVKKYNTIKL